MIIINCIVSRIIHGLGSDCAFHFHDSHRSPEVAKLATLHLGCHGPYFRTAFALDKV